MPYYADLNPKAPQFHGSDWERDPAARERAVERLQKLRVALAAADSPDSPPARRLDTLLIATWNIREFDSATWGNRVPESYLYLAEIIDRFDIVAVQEVRDDMRAFDRLRSRLGPHWDFLVSDVTEGKAGNHERLAFLYDSRKVRFLGMAGELVLPPVKAADGSFVPAAQVARTPLMASFQVGWTKFVLATVHIVYGDKTANPVARVEEIRQVAKFLRRRSDAPTEAVRNLVVLGDFNIFAKGDATMLALEQDGGFTIPDRIQAIPGSNVPKDKKYDQIAFRARQGRFMPTGRAGVFDYYATVFTDDDEPAYRPYIEAYIAKRQADGKTSPKLPATDAARRTQYRQWRTYQMSDHLPLWVELAVDFSDEYLAGLQSTP